MIFNSTINLINLKNLQNLSLFFISIYTLYSCISYNDKCSHNSQRSTFFEGRGIDIYNPKISSCEHFDPFDKLLYLVNLHALIDLFFNKSFDLKLHHLFVLSIFFYNKYFNVSFTNRVIFLYPLIKTEISSIFLILKFWIPKNNIFYHINSILFYLTFFKFRIVDFYNEILYENKNYHYIIENYSKTNIIMSFLLLISLYGLYILNIYWFLIINKILFKKIFINFNTNLLCHYVCSYLQFINIPLSIYIYSYKPNEKYFYDITGIILLSIYSYKYHYNKYDNLNNNKIDDLTSSLIKQNINYFYNDLLSINLRSFLTIVSNYKNNKYVNYAITASAIIHLNFIYISTNKVIIFLKNEKDTDFNYIFYYINNSIPILLDVILIFLNSPNNIAIPFLLTNIVIALLFVVNPFYKLTHVAFHVLLILQNYYLSLSNLNSN